MSPLCQGPVVAAHLPPGAVRKMLCFRNVQVTWTCRKPTGGESSWYYKKEAKRQAGLPGPAMDTEGLTSRHTARGTGKQIPLWHTA